MCRIFSSIAAAILGLGVMASAFALPVTYTLDGPGTCDAVTPTGLHELGIPGLFPVDESIIYSSNTVDHPVCAPTNLPGVADTIVTIMNLSGKYWNDLWFVSDFGDIPGVSGGAPGATLTNIDHFVNGGEAFRIDGLVTPGINNPLISESIDINEVFEPGEVWQFVIQDWAHGGVVCPPGLPIPGMVAFTSPGLVGFPSCTEPDDFFSSASIIGHELAFNTVSIPEPVTFALWGMGLTILGFSRRKSQS